MDYERLVRPGPLEFYVTTMNKSDFENLYLRMSMTHKEAVVRKIRGNKCKTLDDLFNEVGAALQFPWYFGENWPAFSECMSDLDWLPSDVYLFLVSQANLLL